MKKNLEWEQIDDYTRRARVFGGWLVESNAPVYHNMMEQGRGMEDGWDWRIATCFVPDPNNKWRLDNE
jgi:hypothetical protein